MGKIRFSAKISKFGYVGNTERRCIIIPIENLKEVIKEFGDKKILITLEKL